VINSGIKQDPVSKMTSEKGAGVMAPVVEYMPGKSKALNLNPSTTKKIIKRNLNTKEEFGLT
jgi:hypothetical protein